MARSLFEAIVLFGAPFVFYGIILFLRQRYPWLAASWSRGSLALLTLAGLGLVVLGLLGVGVFADRHQGGYAPAHIENGRLVPGRLQ